METGFICLWLAYTGLAGNQAGTPALVFGKGRNQVNTAMLGISGGCCSQAFKIALALDITAGRQGFVGYPVIAFRFLQEQSTGCDCLPTGMFAVKRI